MASRILDKAPPTKTRILDKAPQNKFHILGKVPLANYRILGKAPREKFHIAGPAIATAAHATAVDAIVGAKMFYCRVPVQSSQRVRTCCLTCLCSWFLLSIVDTTG